MIKIDECSSSSFYQEIYSFLFNDGYTFKKMSFVAKYFEIKISTIIDFSYNGWYNQILEN